MNTENTLAPIAVKDEETLEKCREALNQWSKNLPFACTHRLGDDGAFVAATMYHYYSFDIASDIIQREFKLLPGGNPRGSGKDISRYDVWKRPENPEEGDLDIVLEETAHRVTCEKCHGEGKFQCPQCHGEGHYTCTDCGGSGHSTCFHCWGRGYNTKKRVVGCTSCNGTGRKEKLFGGYKTCSRCGGSGNVTEKYEETCSRCGGSGHVECDTCSGTGIEVCSKCKGDGILYCDDCEGRGWNPFVWHFIQTPAKEEHGGVWCDEGIPDVFQFSRNVEFSKRSLSGKTNEKRIGKEVVKAFEAPFMPDLRLVWDEHDAKSASYDSSRIWHESYDFVQYDALVRYEYTYKGKPYQAWIDLAREHVFETQGTGLFLELAEATAKSASKTSWLRPQKAISEYARACAVAAGNKGAIQQYASKLRGRLSLVSWLFRLASAGVGGWFWSQYLQTCGAEPYLGWAAVGVLSCVDILFAHRSAWMSAAGLMVLLVLGESFREFYPRLNLPKDISLMRYLIECALLFSGLTLIFSRDLCLRTYGGLLVPILSGAAIGFLSAPNAALDFASDPDQMAMWLKCTVGCVWAIALVRTVSRSWVQSGWMAAVSFGPRMLRWQTKWLRPGRLMSLVWITLLVSGYCAYEKYAGHGVSPEQRMTGIERLLATPASAVRGRGYLQELASAGHVPAIVRVGELQLDGLCGYEKDEISGYKRVLAASEKGDVRGLLLVGRCRELGIGTGQDLAGAFIAYREGAEAGDVPCREAAERIKAVAACWAGAHNGDPKQQHDLAVCYQNGFGIAVDVELARKWLLKSADAGFIKSQVLAANWLKDGICGAKEPSLAARYCLKAAESGDVDSLFTAGLFYAEGKCLPQDDGKALSCFEKASAKKHDGATFMAGCFYRDGRGGASRPEKAFSAFKEAGDRDFLPAKYALGKCFENGVGIATNYTAALACYRAASVTAWQAPDKSCTTMDARIAAKRIATIGEHWELAQNGDAAAQDAVGMCFAKGDGVDSDKARAFEWYKKAAENDYDRAIIHMGNALFSGDGMTEDKVAAAKAYLRVKDISGAEACYNLGLCYEQGVGVGRNMTRAHELFVKSADAGNASAQDAASHIEIPAKCWDRAIQVGEAEAQYDLAECFRDGDKGLEKDEKKAFGLFKKSADQGFGPALYELAVCYQSGRGVEANDNLMKTLLMRSVEKDYPKAFDLAADLLCQGVAYPRNYTIAYRYYGKALSGGVATAEDKMKKIDELAKWWDDAHGGNADAQYHLGYCYWKGVQTEADEDTAKAWFEKAVAQGHHDAEYGIAVITDSHRTDKGDETTDKRVVSLLQRSAAAGNRDAKVLLGKYMYHGWGMDDDVDQAVKTWTETDTAEAQYYLGEHYWNGTGLFGWGKDREKAKRYWRQSWRGGYKPAEERLRQAENK